MYKILSILSTMSLCIFYELLYLSFKYVFQVFLMLLLNFKFKLSDSDLKNSRNCQHSGSSQRSRLSDILKKILKTLKILAFWWNGTKFFRCVMQLIQEIWTPNSVYLWASPRNSHRIVKQCIICKEIFETLKEVVNIWFRSKESKESSSIHYACSFCDNKFVENEMIHTGDKKIVERFIMKKSLFHVDFVTKHLRIMQKLLLTHHRRNSLTKVTLRSCWL